MSNIRQQAIGIERVCQTVLADKSKDHSMADNQTIETARAILAEAKKQVSGDNILEVVTLNAPVFWTTILTAMEIVLQTVPVESGVAKKRSA